MKRARAADPCHDRAPPNFERKHDGIADRRAGIEDGVGALTYRSTQQIGSGPSAQPVHCPLAMTPQEQQLIAELLARLKQTPAQAKDAGADQLIRKGVKENPEAPYLLVQTVLIQDMALSQAQHRVAELEDQLSKAKAASSLPQSVSFLGGVLSRAAGTSGRASQPVAPAPEPAAPPPAMSSTSSGFLRSAAATALGVAGGQLLFQGVESMFGQHAGSILSGQSVPPTLNETVVNNFNGDQTSDPTAGDDDSGRDGSDQDFDVDDTFSDNGSDGDDLS